MKIAVIGHSLIHPRQQLFFDYMNSLDDVEILQIYPKSWGSQSREGGFKVAQEGSIREFAFGDDAFQAIRDFSPQILYSQTEWWQAQAFRSHRWAATLKIPLVFFFWENIQTPSPTERKLIDDASLIVCGNKEGYDITISNLCTPRLINLAVMPQVGIRTDIFKPLSTEKLHDVLFVGRPVESKGMEYVKRLEDDGFSVLRANGAEYISEMPVIYNSARVLVVPSLTTSTWSEQWPACIAESLACEIPVVTFDSGSIKSNYGGCGNVEFVKSGYYQELEDRVEAVLFQDTLQPTDHRRRKWVEYNMGHEAIAKKLLKSLEDI